MKRIVSLLLALLTVSTVLFSCADGNIPDAEPVPTESAKPAAAQKTEATQEYIDYNDIESYGYRQLYPDEYVRFLVDYINEPFADAAELTDVNFLYIAARYCAACRNGIGFVEKDTSASVIRVSGENMKKLIKILFGIDVSLDSYTLSEGDSYDAGTDTYTFSYTDGAWGEQDTCFESKWDKGSDGIREIYGYTYRLTDGRSAGAERWLIYSFEEVEDGGFTYNRLLSVKESEPAGIDEYAAGLVMYFHEPYTPGDPISEEMAVNLAAYTCIMNKFIYPFLEVDTELMNIRISSADMKSLIKSLTGVDVDLSKCNDSLEWVKYRADEDAYVIPYATDYWGGDNYAILKASGYSSDETADSATVTMYTYYYPSLGAEKENIRKMEYSFKKITDGSVLYYKLTQIKEVV